MGALYVWIYKKMFVCENKYWLKLLLWVEVGQIHWNHFLRGEKSPTSSGLMNPGISVFFFFTIKSWNSEHHQLQCKTEGKQQNIKLPIWCITKHFIFQMYANKKNNMKTNTFCTWTRRQCYVRMEDTQQNVCIFIKIKIKLKIFFIFFSRKLILRKKNKKKLKCLHWSGISKNSVKK